MKITTIPVGYLATNCYILEGERRECVVIDPGDEAKKILDFLRIEQLSCRAILLTHGHFDHVGAVCEVRRETNAKVYIAEADKGQIDCDPDAQLYDGMRFVEAGICFEVIETPGHTKGSVCYLADGVLFSGDTLFCEDIGRTDLPGGSYTEIRESLAKLRDLPFEDLPIFPGHEESTTLAHERANNRYLVK